MNLLCPNCQKMLTVDEQYAGQLMKCPLCQGTFTVPALPEAAGAPSPVPAQPPPEAPDHLQAAPPPPPPEEPSAGYAVQEPPPAPPPDRNVFDLEAPSDGYSAGPDQEATAATAPPEQITSAPSGPGPGTAPELGYRHRFTLSLSPVVLQYIAPAALLLIFILQFFPWVGIYPGGVTLVSQNAWGAAFGSYSPDPDLPGGLEEKNQPGVSLLTIFYLLMYFLVTAVTVACVVVPLVSTALPPNLQPLLSWRWGIAAALNLFLFLFLALQLLLGFSLESRFYEAVHARGAASASAEKTAAQAKLDAMNLGIAESALKRTFWLRLVVLLHLLAIFTAGLTFWLDQRSPGRPLPKLELQW